MKPKRKWIGTILLTLFIATITVSGLFLLRNRSLNNLLEKEKIRSESLLSERLDLEKSMAIFKNGYKNEVYRLTNQNEMLKSILTDNYRIEALKGRNEQLTVTARRTNNLLVSFDLPDDSSEGLHFNLITPGGQKISSREDLFASIHRSNPDPQLMASISGGASEIREMSSRVELSYRPNRKLNPGIYSFQIFDGDKYLGSAQLRLK